MPMIKCPECSKEISDLADKCPDCGFPLGLESSNIHQTVNNQYQPQPQPVQYKTEAEKKNSSLGIVALVLSVLGCTFWLGLILAIIDLCKKDGRKRTCSIIAVCVSILWVLIALLAPSTTSKNDEPIKVETTVPIIEENKIDEEIKTEELKDDEEKTIQSAEIIFKDISWGTSFQEIDEKLEAWDLWNISGENYKECSVDEILLGDYKGIDFEYNGINVISNAFNGEQEVAGYTTSEITLYFSYLPVEGYLTYEEKDTALYGAQYKFEPVNLQDMYEDLKQKLINIYGEPSKQTEDVDLWKNKYTYTYWYGANDTELVMRSLNSENDTTDLYEDEIYITYAWRNGDNLLKNASNAVKKEKSDKEKAVQGNQDGSGL